MQDKIKNITQEKEAVNKKQSESVLVPKLEMLANKIEKLEKQNT